MDFLDELPGTPADAINSADVPSTLEAAASADVGDDAEGLTEDEITVKLANEEELESALCRLLDLELPFINSPMITFLCKEHVMMAFVRSLTRVPIECVTTVNPWEAADFASADFSPEFFAAHRATLTADRLPLAVAGGDAALKRAYRAMNLLNKTQPSSTSLRVVRQMAPVIVRECFRVFHPKSVGSFHHTFSVLETILLCMPGQFVKTLMANNGEQLSWYFAAVVNHMHQPRMADLLVDMVTLTASPKPSPNSGMGHGPMGMGMGMGMDRGMTQQTVQAPVKLAWYKALGSMGLLEHLASHVYSPEYSIEHSEAVAVSIMKILHVLCKEEQSTAMLRVLGLSSTLIAGLAKAAFAVPSAATPAAAAGPEDPPEESSEAGGGAGAGAGAGAPSDNPDDSGSGDTPGAAVASSGGAEDSGAAADAAAAAEIITARQRIALDLLSNLTELAFKPSLVLPATSMMMAGMPPRQIPNTLASVAGLIYTRLLREMSLMCDWLCHTNMRYHSVYGTAHEPTRGTARMANTPKSPYEPAKRASQDAADSVRYSGYSVRAPFGSARLAAVRLIVTMIDRDAKSMLAALTPDVWKVLTAWFLEYRHNNLFHTAYTKIWVAAVMSSHPSLQVCLPASTAISSFIEHYRSGPNSSAKGTILKMLNVLRLKVDSLPPTEWLRQHVRHHDGWQKFLPELIEESKRMVTKPVASRWESRFRQAGLIPDKSSSEPDVSLGSQFADSLGFANVKPNTESDIATPKRRKKKKKGKRRGRTSSNDAAAGASAGSGNPADDAGTTTRPAGDSDGDDAMCNTSSPVPGEENPEVASLTAAFTSLGADGAAVGAGGGQAASESDSDAASVASMGPNNAEQQGGAGSGGKKRRRKRKKKKKKNGGGGGGAGAGDTAADGGAESSSASPAGGSGAAADNGTNDDPSGGSDDETQTAMELLMAVE